MNIRKFCAALVLTATLILPVFAGETQFPGVTSSPDTTQQCVTGETQFPGAAPDCPSPTADTTEVYAIDAVDPVMGITLTLLESLLSFF